MTPCSAPGSADASWSCEAECSLTCGGTLGRSKDAEGGADAQDHRQRRHADNPNWRALCPDFAGKGTASGHRKTPVECARLGGC